MLFGEHRFSASFYRVSWRTSSSRAHTRPVGTGRAVPPPSASCRAAETHRTELRSDSRDTTGIGPAFDGGAGEPVAGKGSPLVAGLRGLHEKHLP